MSTTLPAPEAGQADPSMEDILASIRRILNDGEAPPEDIEAPPPGSDATDDDVLVLEESMLAGAPAPSAPPLPARPIIDEPTAEAPVATQPSPPPEPRMPAEPSNPPPLIAPETELATQRAMGSLVQAMATRDLRLHRDGPTLEDMVRAELRPMLTAWLDAHLPPMVERLVQTELDRVIARAA